jgi:hypothetical protein
MATNTRTFAVGLAMAASLCCALAQTRTVSATFGGATVNLVIPKGYCAMPRDAPVGVLYYRLLEARFRGDRVVPLIFMDCAQWTQRQADPLHPGQDHYGAYLLELTNGLEQLVAPTNTRAKRVQDFISAKIRYDGGTVEDLEARMKEAREMSAAQIRPPEPSGETPDSPVKFRFEGLLDRDELAVYAGSTYSVPNAGKTDQGFGVTGVTVVRRVPMHIVMYAPLGPRYPFKQALEQQKELIRKLVEANE